MHRAISQSLGKSSARNRVCEEKTSDTDDDEARRWRKLEKEADLKKSRRARNEQANFEKGVANFRNASKAEGACVNTPGCSSRSQVLKQGCPVLAWNMLPRCPWYVTLKSPNLPARILSGSFANLRGTEIVLGVWVLCGSEKERCWGSMFSASNCGENFWATVAFEERV